jgi:hypothetical protein
MIVGMWGIKIKASVTVSTINKKIKYILDLLLIHKFYSLAPIFIIS